MKKSLSTVAVFGATYAAACAYLYLRQRELLYRPPHGHLAPDRPVLVLPAAPGAPALHGWIDGPPAADRALVYWGGSSEPIEQRRASLAAAFPEWTRYLMPYRGFGPNSALQASESALKADAARLFEWIQPRHQKISLIGRSLGTGVALATAAALPVHRLGLITPYDSLARVAQNCYRWFPAARLLRDRFESWPDASRVVSPVVACLAGRDAVIPLPRWHELRRHFQTSPTEHHFSEANHTNITDLPGVWSALARFFSEDLVPAPRPIRSVAGSSTVGSSTVGSSTVGSSTAGRSTAVIAFSEESRPGDASLMHRSFHARR